MLLELLELLELRLAMPLFVGGAGLRMSVHEKFIARCYGLSLDLLAEAFVSAHGTDTACLGQSYTETHSTRHMPSYATSVILGYVELNTFLH